MFMGAIELGNLIRDARLRRGWQQQDLATALGVAPGYISTIEAGKRNWPRQYIPAISDALGVDEIDMAIAAGLISPRPDRPAVNPFDPDDPRQQIRDLIERVPDRERLRGVAAMLREWLPAASASSPSAPSDTR